MSRYCSDAIAIAHLAGNAQTGDVIWAMGILDAAERELRHNKNHDFVPLDCSNETFGVEPVKR